MAPSKKSKIVVLRLSPDALKEVLRSVPITPTHNRIKNVAPASSPGGTPEPKEKVSKGKSGPKRKSIKLSAGSTGGASAGVSTNVSSTNGSLVTPSSPYAGDDTISTPKPSGNSGPKTAMAVTIAGVKALDRSGKPCRRWIRKDLEISSFTGIRYTIKSWSGEPDEVKKKEIGKDKEEKKEQKKDNDNDNDNDNDKQSNNILKESKESTAKSIPTITVDPNPTSSIKVETES